MRRDGGVFQIKVKRNFHGQISQFNLPQYCINILVLSVINERVTM